MSTKRILSLVLAMVLTVSLFAGCGGAASSSAPAPAASGDASSAAPAASGDASSAAPAASGDTIKIGYVSALSGDTALWGQAGLNGMLMTAEKVNAAGGVLGRQIEVIGLDGKGDPADSVNAYKKLVDEYKVCAVVGTNFSSCNIPMAAVADQMKVPVIATAASNEEVTVDKDGKLHPYSFRLCFIDSFQGEILGRMAVEKYGFKKGAIITDISDAYSTGVGKFIVESFTKAGGEIVAQEEAQGTDTDFRAQLTKIAAAKPDVLFIPWIYQKVALIATQAKELGINCVMLGADGWDSLELADMAGGALEGSTYVSRIGFNSPEAAAYGEEYAAKYKIDLEAECLFGNDGLLWALDAIERAGSDDPVAVRDALEATTTFKGLLGEMTMDPATHNPTRDIAVYTCKDGKFNYEGIFK